LFFFVFFFLSFSHPLPPSDNSAFLSFFHSFFLHSCFCPRSFFFSFFLFFFTSIPQLLSDDAEWRCWATRDGLVSGFHVASWGVGQFRRVSDGLEQHGKCRSVINDQFQRLEKKNFSAFFILPETLSGSSYQSSWRKADF